MSRPLIFLFPSSAPVAGLDCGDSVTVLRDGRAASGALQGPGPVLLDAAAFCNLSAQAGTLPAEIWVEFHPGLDPVEPEVMAAALARLCPAARVVLGSGDLDCLAGLARSGPLAGLALKSCEAAGAGSSEAAGILLDHARRVLGPDCPPLIQWGGVATPEAAAAFLATGAASVVLEQAHWLTDTVGLPKETAARLRKLKYDASTAVAAGERIQWRFFDKGNSKAVRGLRHMAVANDPAALAAEVRRVAVPLERSALSADELIPFGADAPFAAGFADRFGLQTGAALRAFAEETLRLWDEAPARLERFGSGGVAAELGSGLPLIQGAMSWISDSPAFARAVAEAGALPTLAVGSRSRADLERDFGGLAGIMGDKPYSVNVLVLDENPRRAEQLQWLEAVQPPLVTVAAGEPSFAAGLRAKGMEVLYLAADVELLRLAVQAGVRFVVLEGCEAGGHVGRLTTLTLAQAALELRRHEPGLLRQARIVLAGGVHDAASAARTVLLGADALQLGTAYLACHEIVASGALSSLYQQEILSAGFGATHVGGESVGLRVRALDTPMSQTLRGLERRHDAGEVEEAAFRRELEELAVGSLLVAAKGRRKPDGEVLPPEVCREQGQFMSGAVAGELTAVRGLAELHAAIMAGAGALVPAPRRKAPAVHIAAQRERVAITGMAMFNSLGRDADEIVAASLGGRNGVGRVPADRWDHNSYFDANPQTGSRTYSQAGAFMRFTCTRKDLGVSPQDFRTMSQSTRLTLLLARRAVQESGLLESGIPGERIAVLTSQNSAEGASTVKPLLYNVFADEICGVVSRALRLTPEQRAAAAQELAAEGLAVDDTTLIGRLNCTASGHICNMFGFGGPSYSVGAACASSLIALYNAVLLIRAGVIDAAVVGGGEEVLTPGHYLEFSALRSLAGLSGQRSPERQSRPFDKDRDGFVLGEGGAVVVLERESLARRRKAPVQAFISGVGACTNHLGIVESVAETQTMALRAAFQDSGFMGADLDLVECHGTSTMQGDREEVTALKAFFPDNQGTVLSSFKSQIGHTLGASGLSSLIRGVGAMRRGMLPLSLNYETPDPEIGLEAAGFRVLHQAEAWPAPGDHPRRMQVNAFGFGGACVVVHLEADPDLPDLEYVPSGNGLSPSSPARPSFHTASAGGREYRVGLCRDTAAGLGRLREQAARGLTPETLARLARRGVHVAPADEAAPPLALICSGQGSFYPGMGRQLVHEYPAVAEAIARLSACADYDLKELLLGADADRLLDTRWQQPSLFAFEFAVASQLMALGLRPAALAGHSLGEFTALCLAGVLSPEDAFRVVDMRGRLMSKAASLAETPGTMAAVDLPVEILQWKLAKYPGLTITNYNSPKQTVVGGDAAQVRALVDELKAQGNRAALLKVSMAFHSPVMRVIREEFGNFLEGVEFHAPQIPVLSNATKTPFPDDAAAIRGVVLAHLESPVHWMQNVFFLWSELGVRRFLEVGPADVLSGLVRDIFDAAQVLPTSSKDAEAAAFGEALAALYAQGDIRPLAGPTVLNLTETEAPARRSAAPAPGGNTLEQVIRIIMDATGYERNEIEPGMDIRQDLSIRSSRLPVIMDQAERIFGLTFRIEDFIGVRTVREMAEAIDRLGGSAAAAASPAPAQAPGGDTLEQVIRIIMDATGYEREEIEPDMDIRQDLSIRSSRLPVIMDQAERIFGLTFRIEDFIGVRTVREMAEAIDRLGAAGAKKTAPAAPLAQAAQPAAESSGFEPVFRAMPGEAALEAAPERLPADIAGKPLLVVATGRTGQDLGERLARDLGMERVALDLGAPAPAGLAPAGLVLCLDPDGVAGQDLEGLLAGVFRTLQKFILSPAKRFCLLVLPERPHGDPARICFEGALGMLLTLAQEYQSVTCRALRLAADVEPAEAALTALSTPGPVERICRGGGVFTPRFEPCPAPAAEAPAVRPGDVILMSGGAKGVTARLAAELAPLGPRLVLLGRSPEGEAERATLERLRSLGAEAEYAVCDVADAAAVQKLVADVRGRLGRVDGLVHGAGLLRDTFLAMMSEADFAAVVAVKLRGLRNLIEAAPGLRFVAAFSSVAAWQGNVGQVNYCCANRAMASLLLGLPEVAGRVLWLPPVAGVGMASGEEIRELMRLKGMSKAYVDAEELAPLFCRELLFAGPGPASVLLARHMPSIETVVPPALPADEAAAGALLPVAGLPMLDEMRLDSLAPLAATALRRVSHERDPWLPDHRPYPELRDPLFSAVMVVETFCEAARALQPHLSPVGLSNVRFLDILPCSQGQERELRVHIARSAAHGPETALDAHLESRDVSPRGRPLDRWSTHFQGSVLLAAKPESLKPWPDFAPVKGQGKGALSPQEMEAIYLKQTRQTGRYRVIHSVSQADPSYVAGNMRYRLSDDVRGFAGNFLTSPYLLEALMQAPFMHEVLLRPGQGLSRLPAGVGSVRFGRPCRNDEEITLLARLRAEDAAGAQTWDACGLAQDGEILMQVQGLVMKQLRG